MQLAERYGRSPEEVENWDAYWFNRAVVALEGESIDAQRKAKEMTKTGSARRK